jgi:hypothetical protein
VECTSDIMEHFKFSEKIIDEVWRLRKEYGEKE